MDKTSYKLLFSILLLLISCGNEGIEGFVNEPITISANNPEDGQDVDYYWTLLEQPDGSLLNSSDLIASDAGQEMIFTPDYPGNYSIEVDISQYGDEISNQTFSFSILEISEKNIEKTVDEESWLDEELDENIEKEVEEVEEVEEEKNIESFISEKDKKAFAAMGKMALNKKINNKNQSKSLSAKIKEPKKTASIAAKTDRFTIQITSKKMLNDAQLFSQKLIKKGYDSYIQKVVFNGNEIWYRVRVGSYDNYNVAKKAADALSDELGMTTWVDFVRKDI